MNGPYYFTVMDTITKHFYAYCTTVLEPGENDRELLMRLPYTTRTCAEVHSRMHKMIQDRIRVSGGCYLLEAQEKASHVPYAKGYGKVEV